MGPEPTDFGFFGLLGFVKGKSQFSENFRSPGQFWPALELSEPKSPKKGSPRDIKRKRNYAALNDRNSKFFFRFCGAFTKPEKMAGVSYAIFSYDAPYCLVPTYRPITNPLQGLLTRLITVTSFCRRLQFLPFSLLNFPFS